MRLFRIRRYPPQKRRNRTPSYLAAPRSASENSNYLPNKPFSRFLASSSSFLRFASASASARFCASACTCPAFCSAVCSAFDESTPKARPSNAVPPSFTIWFTAGFRSRSAAVGVQAGPISLRLTGIGFAGFTFPPVRAAIVAGGDRESGVEGKGGELGGRRIIKKKKE